MDVAARGLRKVREDYADDRLTAVELEEEVAFWLSVEDCPVCNQQMCSAHYTTLSGR